MDASLPPRQRLVCFLATDPSAVQEVLLACERELPDPFGLGVGIRLTTDLVRGKSIRAPWGALMPTRAQARTIGAFTTPRFSPLRLHARTEAARTEDLLTELAGMFEYAGRIPDILHLENGPYWPEAAVLENLHTRHPDLRFLIHLSPLLQARLDYQPAACVAELVERYRPLLASHGGPLTHVLWDGSGTRLTSDLNAREALAFVKALQALAPGVEAMLSGGLGPDSSEIIDPVCAATRAFSVEANRLLAAIFNGAPDTQRTIAFIQQSLRRLAPS